MPLKDVKEDFLAGLSDGKYCGHNSILQALRNDTFEVIIGNKIQNVPRWAMNIVNQDLRNPETIKETNQMAQFARLHCGATISSGELKTIPAEELAIDHVTHRPVIGIRVYHGGSSAVLVHLAYFYHYGHARCNLSQDTHLEEGVYA